MKRIASAVLAIVLCLCLCAGCMGRVIEEDYAGHDLPDIDPEDGVEKEVAATLYYRLTNEEYLVGVNRSIQVRASERTEAAVIRTLIAGVPLLARDVSPLFSPDVRVIDVTYEGGILYVTLSGELLDDSVLSQVDREDYLTDEDYQAAVSGAEEEMYLVRRLGVLSIVNTLAGGSEEDLKVQIMVDTEGDGAGRRVTCQELGFEGYEQELIEPLAFDEEAVATPVKVAGCLLEHMALGEYEMAYVLVAESDDTGTAKPTYADFETELRSLGRLASYAITDSRMEAGGAFVTADIRYTSPEGAVIQVSNAQLYLQEEGDLYKVGYGSLKGMMEN